MTAAALRDLSGYWTRGLDESAATVERLAGVATATAGAFQLAERIIGSRRTVADAVKAALDRKP